MLVKKIAIYLLVFFLAQTVQAASEKPTRTISETPTWPTAKEQEVINNAVNKYPLKEQLPKKQRYYNIENNALLLNKKIINEPLKYSQTTFNNTVKLFLIQFNQPIYFVLSTFNKEAIFSSTTAKLFANFEQAIFTSKASFNYCTFDNIVNFYGAVFNQPVTFYRTKFYDLNLTDAAFRAAANFTEVNITKQAVFVDANFDSTVSFSETVFGRMTQFNHTIFNGSVDFSNAKFGHTAVFERAQFHGEVIFNNTRMPDYLDFSHIHNIQVPINMNVIQNQFNRIKQINLVGTNIKKLILDYDLYQLYFPPGTSDSAIMEVYQNLIHVQKQLGFSEGLKKLSIEFKIYQYTKNEQYIQYFFDKYMWNFGFDVSSLLRVIIFIILFFTLINGFFYRKLVHSTYRVPFLDIQSHSRAIEQNALFRYLFYLPLAFIYTILILLGGIFGSVKREGIERHHLLLSIYFATMVICGFLCTFILLKYVFSL